MKESSLIIGWSSLNGTAVEIKRVNVGTETQVYACGRHVLKGIGDKAGAKVRTANADMDD